MKESPQWAQRTIMYRNAIVTEGVSLRWAGRDGAVLAPATNSSGAEGRQPNPVPTRGPVWLAPGGSVGGQKLGLGGGRLDGEPFPAAAGDVHGVEFASPYPVQDGLAGDAE